MNRPNLYRIAVVILSTLLLSAVACSDDPADDNQDECPDISQADCPEETPRLDSDRCICVECIADQHCDDIDCVQGACMQVGDGGECTSDEDCQLGEICHDARTCVQLDCQFCDEDQICYDAHDPEGSCSAPECDGSDDCDGGVCDDGICREADEGECAGDDDCPDGEICDFDDEQATTGVCLDPDAYFGLVVEDVTHEHGEPGRCDDTIYGYDTAGAKIYDVVLLDGDTVLGHATASQFTPGDGQDFTTEAEVFEIFDGTDPEFEGDCPDVDEMYHAAQDSDDYESSFNYDHVAALGCGGAVYLYFDGDDGRPVALAEGLSIEVYSYGEQCSLEYIEEVVGTSYDSCEDVETAYCPQHTVDPYRVHLCDEPVTEQGVTSGDVCGLSVTDAPTSGDVERIDITTD